jgi:hypothetical protein
MTLELFLMMSMSDETNIYVYIICKFDMHV